MIEQIVFFIFTLMTLGGGLGMVTTRNIYYAALYLTLSLSGVAGYFVLLNAGFLAAVQIVVYVGAIAILILFAIMLSRHVMTTSEPQANKQSWLGGAVVLLLFAALLFVVFATAWPLSSDLPTGNTLTQLGMHLVGGYLIPFEVVSVLLLVALIGAIILASDSKME